MKTKHIPGVVGSLISIGIMWTVIHFWGAQWYGEMIDISREAAYLYLMALLVLVNGWRIRQILTDKDKVTKRMNDWIEK